MIQAKHYGKHHWLTAARKAMARYDRNMKVGRIGIAQANHAKALYCLTLARAIPE